MKDFAYYLASAEVRKRTTDISLARSLILDMHLRIKDANALIIDLFPKIIFESMYDALRDFCDALLAAVGYKSYSHEASISYLKTIGFDFAFISELDAYRIKRNGSKYYGVKITVDDAKAILEFYNKNMIKIEDIINQL